MTTIKVVEILDNVMLETELEVLFIRNDRTYRGPLFWDFNEDRQTGSKIVKVIEEWITDPTETSKDKTQEDLTCYDIYLHLCDKHGIKTYESTMKTMKHWSFINGFTDIYHR